MDRRINDKVKLFSLFYGADQVMHCFTSVLVRFYLTVKSIEKDLMIWECLSSRSVGKIIILEGKVNASLYLNILKDTVIPEENRLIGEHFLFQPDNAPTHTAKKVLEFEIDTFSDKH